MGASLDISVVIPSYRRPDLLRRCLESVTEARRSSRCHVEVIVVEDGAHEESCELVGARFPDVRLVALPENRGYPGAVNAGVAASQGRWVLTLNNDTTIAPTVFDELLAVADS